MLNFTQSIIIIIIIVVVLYSRYMYEYNIAAVSNTCIGTPNTAVAMSQYGVCVCVCVCVRACVRACMRAHAYVLNIQASRVHAIYSISKLHQQHVIVD